MTPTNRTTVHIQTPSGFDIEAWFYLPEGQGPFPAVVMGHGLGAVKVGGLASFAERFSAGKGSPRKSSTTANGAAQRGRRPATNATCHANARTTAPRSGGS
jgi:fermentation-respiration switch protein FrsA (DUF1100 family)